MKRRVIRIRTFDSPSRWRRAGKPEKGSSGNAQTLNAMDAISTARRTADAIRAFNAAKNAYYREGAARVRS